VSEVFPMCHYRKGRSLFASLTLLSGVLPASFGVSVVPSLPSCCQGQAFGGFATLDSGRLPANGILSRPEEWLRNRYMAIYNVIARYLLSAKMRGGEVCCCTRVFLRHLYAGRLGCPHGIEIFAKGRNLAACCPQEHHILLAITVRSEYRACRCAAASSGD